jgi:nitrogenase molybdenum-iron protein alpha/beta subunit
VVINPAYGLEIADFMNRRFDQPYIAPAMMPIGFDANRKLMADVLGFFNLSTPAALEDEERHCRKEALLALSHCQRSDLLRGLPVAVFGEYDFVAGLSLFLRDYLGCHPALLGIAGCGEVNCEEIKTLCAKGYDDVAIVLNPDADQAAAAIRKTRPVITFGSAFEEYLMAQMDYCPKFFVQTSTPGYNHANLVHRPYIGYAGALSVIDAVLDCKLTNRYPYTSNGSDPS